QKQAGKEMLFALSLNLKNDKVKPVDERCNHQEGQEAEQDITPTAMPAKPQLIRPGRAAQVEDDEDRGQLQWKREGSDPDGSPGDCYLHQGIIPSGRCREWKIGAIQPG